MCTPIDFKITYFDENGKEFKVKISWNGGRIENENSYRIC
jgi:hypothetical protein